MRHTNILLISLVLSAACTSGRPLGTAGARRRLSQVSAAAGTLGGSGTAGNNGGVFTDGKYIKGVPILRTTGYSRFDRSTGNLLNADANQAAVREGITNFLVDSQTAYTAARMDRNTRGQLTSEYTQSAIRGGSAAQGTAAGSGVTNLWSNAAGALKMGSNTRRAELAGDRTAAAIRASLDNPNDAFRATATGAVQANSVAWSQNYNGWSR